MQAAQDESGPSVRIREVKKDSVDFVLENVDLAFANSLRRVMMADLPTVGKSSSCKSKKYHQPSQSHRPRTVS